MNDSFDDKYIVEEELPVRANEPFTVRVPLLVSTLTFVPSHVTDVVGAPFTTGPYPIETLVGLITTAE